MGDKKLQAGEAPAPNPSWPLFDEETGKKIIRALVTVLASGYAVFILIEIAAWSASSWLHLIQPVLGLLVCGTGLLALQRHGCRPAGIFLTWSLWTLILASAFLTAGNTTGCLIALPLLIVIGGWLAGTRAAVVMTVLSVAALLVLSLSEATGALLEVRVSPVQRWVLLSTFLIVAAMLVTQVARHYWQRQHAHDALERHLDLLLENVPASVCSLDGNHRYIYANQRYAHFFGHEPEDLVGRTLEEVIGPDAFALRREEFEAASRGQQVHYRRDHIDKTGRRRVIDVDLVPEKKPDEGEVTRYFGMLREVTEEVEALEEARRSEEKFATLFRASPVATSISRMEDGCFIDVNHAYEEMYRVGRQELIGRTSIREGLWNSQEHRAQWLASLGDGRGRHDFETQLTTGDGQFRDVIITSERIDVNGEARMLVLHNDITARKNAEREVRRLNETLEQQVRERTAALTEAMDHLRRSRDELVRAEKLAALGSLVAGLAHELNTPIGNAVTVASTLSEQTKSFRAAIADGTIRKSVLQGFAESSADGTGTLLRNLERAYDLIRNFKQVAVDQTSEHRRPFRLEQTVTEIIASMTPALKREPVTIVTQIDPAIELDSYPGPLGQVLINLINNAVQHAFVGREKGTITITGRRDHGRYDSHGWVQLVVEDDGVGIPPNHLTHIFEPFFTTKLGHGGSGLGLSIIYNIVTNLLGGDVRAESTAAGARFVVDLPLQAPERKRELEP